MQVEVFTTIFLSKDDVDNMAIQAALNIAREYSLLSEVLECIESGMTPEEALKEWDLL